MPEDQEMPQLRQATARGAFWMLAVTVATKGTQGLVTVALAVFLQPDQLGLVSVAVVTIQLAQITQTMGVYDVISRTKRSPLEFSGTVATLSVGTAFALSAVLLVGADWISILLGADASSLIRVGSLGLPFIAYGGVQLALAQRDLAFRSRLWPDTGSAVLGAATTITLAAFGLGEWSLIAGLMVGAVSQPLLGLMVGLRIPLKWDRHAARETAQWSLAVGPGAVLGLVITNMDYVVVTRVLGESATGVYSLAFRIAYLPYVTVAISLAAVAFPVYSKLLRASPDADLSSAFVRFVHAMVVLAGGLYLTVALVANRVVILSPHWKQAGPVLVLLCIYGFLLSFELTCFVALRATGRTRSFVACQAAHAVILLTILPALTDRHGIRGTAQAQIIAATAVALGALLVLIHARVTRWRDLVRATGRPFIALGITAGGGIILRQVQWFRDPSSTLGGAALLMLVGGLWIATIVTLDRRKLRETLASLRS